MTKQRLNALSSPVQDRYDGGGGKLVSIKQTIDRFRSHVSCFTRRGDRPAQLTPGWRRRVLKVEMTSGNRPGTPGRRTRRTAPARKQIKAVRSPVLNC